MYPVKTMVVPAVAVFFSMISGAVIAPQSLNRLTDAERKQGWVLLFNGRDFDGWRRCSGTSLPANWVIEVSRDEGLHRPWQEAGTGGGRRHRVPRPIVQELRAVNRLEDRTAGNSGIFYYVREVPGQPVYYAAPEVQVLDNVDATDNVVPSHLAGSLYDMLPADPKTGQPVGEWNTIVIGVKDGRVTPHAGTARRWSSTPCGRPEWDALVANSRFRTFPGFIEGIAHQGLYRFAGPWLRHLVPEHQDQGALAGSVRLC